MADGLDERPNIRTDWTSEQQNFCNGLIDGGCHDCVSGQLKDMEKAKEDREAQGQIEQCKKTRLFSVYI